jgi:Tol biopolymer transport system component
MISMKLRYLFANACVLTAMASAGAADAAVIFSSPTNLAGDVNSSFADFSPSISADGLTLYFVSTRPAFPGDISGQGNIWRVSRATLLDSFGPASLVANVNSADDESGPNISTDGLTLYFSSSRPGGFGEYDLYSATRPDLLDDFGPATNLGASLNSTFIEGSPHISADGLTLYFASTRPGFGVRDLWVATRLSTSDPFGPPLNMGPVVNSTSAEHGPSVSSDGLTMFFQSERPGGIGGVDLWYTTRSSLSDPFGTPLLVPTVNSLFDDVSPNVSFDGGVLLFASDRPGGAGGLDIWISQVRVTEVPEPGSIATWALLMAAFCARARRATQSRSRLQC